MTQAYMAVLAAFFGSLGFALLYNMRGKRILVPAVGGAFFWGFYLVFVLTQIGRASCRERV